MDTILVHIVMIPMKKPLTYIIHSCIHYHQ